MKPTCLQLSSLTLALLSALPAYAVGSDNHTNTTGDQTVDVRDVTVTDDYWSYATTGNIYMTATDTTVDLGSLANGSTPDFLADSSAGGINFNASNLTTQGGVLRLDGYGDVSATVTDSHLNGFTAPNTPQALWLSSDSGSVSLQITDSTVAGNTLVQADKNAAIAVQNSHLTGGISETTSAQSALSITDSTVTRTNSGAFNVPVIHMEGDKGAQVSIYNSQIGLSDGSDPARNADVEVIASEGGTADVQVNQSQIQNGISTYTKGTDSTIEVSDSQIGTVGTAGDAPYALVAQSSAGIPGEGNATLTLDNTIVYGDISAQSQGGASAAIGLSNGTTVNGDALLIGDTMAVSIDDAMFNGDISTHGTTEGSSETILNVSHTTYRGDISASDNGGDLTVNINDGAIIGGDSLADPMSVTGYDKVNFNINYVDPSLIDTGEESFFYFNTDENVLVNSSLATGTLAPIRSGAYIVDDVTYDARNVSDQTADADKGNTWDVTFHTDGTPVPPDPDPTPDDGGDDDNGGGDDPTPPPPPPTPDDSDVVADLQAAQAGLLASDDMIHRIAGGITRQLDTQANADKGRHLWLQGIYAGGDRTAGVTSYNTDIAGFQLGGDVAMVLKNNSVVHVGAALGYLSNDLDLNNRDGYNDISGNYYSLYASWNQLLSDNRTWGWFADMEATYGDMSYSASGKDGKIQAGGNYDGGSSLVQGRVGAHIHLSPYVWLRPYLTLGYDNVRTDSYDDGYSRVGKGHFHSGFGGVGMKAGSAFSIGQAALRPYVSLAWNGQFDDHIHFAADNYTFAGQDLDGGNVGVGVDMDLTRHWSVSASVNNEFGHDIDKQVAGWLEARYRF